MIKMFIHNGSDNHGCEAIVRSTASRLPEKPVLYSRNPDLDKAYGVDKVCFLQNDTFNPIRRFTKNWLKSAIEQKLYKSVLKTTSYQYPDLFKTIDSQDIYLSIGGDNYCYPGTDTLGNLDLLIKKAGARLVLWGCSIEPGSLEDKHIIDDIRSFDLITARETITYNSVKKYNPNTFLVADPAFLLEPKKVDLPVGWELGNMVGINVSPLVLSANPDGPVLDSVKQLIKHILEETNFGIALIPHVVVLGNDDRTVLNDLFKLYKSTGRVILVDDHNCEELKWIISQCRFFIGSRTHSTIAAYSSLVPTLVIGYSVKSKGIALDLFGSIDHYVASVQEITSKNCLVDKFIWLMDHEQEIVEVLKEQIPSCIKRAEFGFEKLDELTVSESRESNNY